METFKDLIKLSKKISKFVVGSEGNISKKDNDLIYVKSSGSSLKGLSEEDIVCYNQQKQQLTNINKKGTMELDFHFFLLGKKNINYIAHTHPVNTVKLLCGKYAKEFSEKRFFPDQVVFNGQKSCLVPYVLPGKQLAKTIEEFVNKFEKDEKTFPKLILLKNHGIIACGNSVDECIKITDICEKSAKIFIGGKILNSLDYFSDDEIEDIQNDENEKYRKSLL